LSDEELYEGIFAVCGQFPWTKTFLGSGTSAVRWRPIAATETIVIVKITVSKAQSPGLLRRRRRRGGVMCGIVIAGSLVSMMDMDDASVAFVSDRTCGIVRSRW